MAELDGTIAAWRQSLESVLAVGSTLTDADWDAPTECPGWSVKDVYSHLVGGETWMAAAHPRVDSLGHIADEPVATRRSMPPADVLNELRAVYDQRTSQLAEAAPDPEEPTFAAYGKAMPLRLLWRDRAFDVWVHEQDIRRAVALPGNLDSPGAQVAAQLLVGALPLVVAKRAGTPPGSVVQFRVTGPIAFDRTIEIDADGRGRFTDATAGTVLSLEWESFSRLGCGRITPAQANADVSGDVDLANRILGHLAITP